MGFEALSTASESFHWGVDEPQIERALDTCLKAHLAGSQTSEPALWQRGHAALHQPFFRVQRGVMNSEKALRLRPWASIS